MRRHLLGVEELLLGQVEEGHLQPLAHALLRVARVLDQLLRKPRPERVSSKRREPRHVSPCLLASRHSSPSCKSGLFVRRVSRACTASGVRALWHTACRRASFSCHFCSRASLASNTLRVDSRCCSSCAAAASWCSLCASCLWISRALAFRSRSSFCGATAQGSGSGSGSGLEAGWLDCG